MKTLLTIITYGDLAAGKDESLPKATEIIAPASDAGEGEFLLYALKQAKGKYIVFCRGAVAFADIEKFISEIGACGVDVLRFRGGAAYKSALFKGISQSDCADGLSCEAFAVFNAKTLETSNAAPLAFAGPGKIPEAKNLIRVADKFKKVKAKLTKEVYGFAVDLILPQLIRFYMQTMLDIRDGALSADVLIRFDNRLKEDIVLYLALEKRFKAANLNKLREKGFKISAFTARRFKRASEDK